MYKVHKNKSFESQAKFLLFFIASGFLLVCVTAFLALFGLKDEYDHSLGLYLQKTHSLQQIQQFYEKIEVSQNPSELLQKYSEIVLPEWKIYKLNPAQKGVIVALKEFYQDLFLRQEVAHIEHLHRLELESIKALDEQLKYTELLLENIQTTKASFDSIKQHLLIHSVQVVQYLKELFQNNMQIVLIGRTITESIYDVTLWLLLIFAGIVSFGTLYFAAMILSFVRSIYQDLQKTIENQTRELKTTNQNLQKTIEYEIEQSRKKDQIMYQQARLASMGEMIQNIAHQWRQPLNSLTILIQSFQVKYGHNKLDDAFVAKQTEDGLRIAKNMSDTIENFRNFFQPNIKRSIFSVPKSIEDSIRLIKPTLEQNNIQVFFEHTSNIEIFGYENAFSQVVLNIIKNSQDVLTTLEFNTSSSDTQDMTQGIIEIILRKSDSLKDQKLSEQPAMAELLIMDNGGGIQIPEIDKIFEPYFTTKHKSVGTGIGLYMVKQIVERQMGGSIEVKNAFWRCSTLQKKCFGAIFMIRFPLYLEQDMECNSF